MRSATVCVVGNRGFNACFSLLSGRRNHVYGGLHPPSEGDGRWCGTTARVISPRLASSRLCRVRAAGGSLAGSKVAARLPYLDIGILLRRCRRPKRTCLGMIRAWYRIALAPRSQGTRISRKLDASDMDMDSVLGGFSNLVSLHQVPHRFFNRVDPRAGTRHNPI